MSHSVFIVDTNVVVAGLITGNSDSPVALILDRMLSGEIIYLLSPALLDEYKHVLTRPKLMRLHGLSQAQLTDLLTELTANAIWREAAPSEPAPDRGDDHLWALLAAHSASVLITGDQLLLNNPPPSSSVISPATWLREFGV